MIWQEKRNYFIVDGVKYYSGTIFIINRGGKEIEATFSYDNVSCEYYMYRIGQRGYTERYKDFWEHFVAVTGKINPNEQGPVLKRKKEFDIPGMALGWTWYVFLMLLSSIFKDAFGLWILLSVVFFNWRSKRIKEQGYYYEY